MGRLLKALEKVGLVEVAGAVDEAEPAGTVQDSMEPIPSDPPLATGDEQSPRPGGEAIKEGLPFESFYSGMPASPYPAEKMLKLIDGLQAMDAATRHSAIQAMDAADDSWGIDDAVSDAQAKIAALTAQASAFTAQVTAIEKETGAALKALEADNDKAVSAIRKQIAELEALLARQIEKTGSDKTAAQSQLQSAREACTRETGRLHAEALRLSVLVEMFGATK